MHSTPAPACAGTNDSINDGLPSAAGTITHAGMTLLGNIGGGSGRGPGNAAGPLKTVTEKDFEAEVLRSELTVLLEFGSERSPICKQIEPILQQLAQELEDKAKILKVDVERSPYLAQQLRVQQIPTFMVWAGGRPADLQVGPMSKKQLQAMVEPFLPRPAGALKAMELAELLKKGVVAAVDTRDAGAFSRARIPGAIHMPLEELEGRVAELYMLPGTPVLYCRGGDKTKEFVAKMAESNVELGFLEGGMLAWESDGFPIER